jgi:hypothetical protein
MTSDRHAMDPNATPARRPYEPPAVIEVFVDPAKDMLVACAPGKLPNSGHATCATAHFT